MKRAIPSPAHNGILPLGPNALSKGRTPLAQIYKLRKRTHLANALPPRRCLSTTPSPSPKTALFFPGQGVQRIGMTAPWLAAFPQTCRPFLEETDALLSLPTPLSEIIAHGPNSTLTATPNAQPAIFATSIMILRVLEEEFHFDTAARVSVSLGHSLGEFAALVAANHLTYPAALKLVRHRAEQMSACSLAARAASLADGGSGEYGMIALVCEPDHLTSLTRTIHAFLGHGASEGGKNDSSANAPPIDQVLVANVNSKNQIVLSGNVERIQALLVQIREFGGHDPRAVRLATDSPFHSPIMSPAREWMRKELERTEVRWPGSFPVVSNVSARPFGDVAGLKDLLARQCVETVRWWDSIRFLDEGGVRRWVGVGPGKVGRNLVGKEVGIGGRVKGGGVWGLSGPGEVEGVLRGLEETEGMG